MRCTSMHIKVEYNLEHIFYNMCSNYFSFDQMSLEISKDIPKFNFQKGYRVSNKKFLIWLLNCKLLRHDFGLHGKHLSLCRKGWAYFLCNFSKGKEIEFINTLEAQNKRHEIMSKHQVSEARLQDIQVSGTGVCVRERLTPGHTEVMQRAPVNSSSYTMCVIFHITLLFMFTVQNQFCSCLNSPLD